ncbi:MAG TPA: histidinol dehydrogenase [Candidatus Paceibacterota bacterium]|nr:histidinol dehydrogenase [Candidatus Paceibacterota bacterium]HSA00415.1 histidinol dehydrogenase [Candidatus Paceibacterota bacterium]
MRVLRQTDGDYAERLQAMAAASSLFDPEIERKVRPIIGQVAARGDAALLKLTQKFDGARLTLNRLRISTAELVSASIRTDEPLRKAVDEATRNIETFCRHSLRKGWMRRNEHGARVGEKFDPFDRVGIYIPAGTAPLISTALMTIVLARVAGCPEIVVCTPCDKTGEVNPALLYALAHSGATEIYRVGGAQAIAAMALGTATLRPVQKIFGPGNAYVVAAKRLLFGRVAIDLLPGPSEVLILADKTAKAGFIAADLLAQAEHGSGHERIWVVTNDPKLLRTIPGELRRQLPPLKRRTYIERVLHHNCWLILVKNMDEATRVTNLLAPEHCEIMTRQPDAVAAEIKTAGAIFLGPYSPTVLGDYLAGPSHELPTGGAGRCFAGLTVDQFQRRTSLVQYSQAGVRLAFPSLRILATREGLEAHANSAAIRLKRS